MRGKSHHAQKVNSQIDKINVAINARYREILSMKGQATVNEVKNAFTGNAFAQETILKLFREHNEDLEKRIGVNRAKRQAAFPKFRCWTFRCSWLKNTGEQGPATGFFQ